SAKPGSFGILRMVLARVFTRREPLINTRALARWKYAPSTGELFQPQKCASDVSDHGFQLLFLRVKLVFRLPAQSSLLVKIVPEVQTRHFLLSGDAKRLANIGILFRRDAPDSLQRSGASATVLSATAFALA